MLFSTTTPHKTHHHTTGKQPKHHHPRHHNNNNKIRDQREKVKNQNHKKFYYKNFKPERERIGVSGFVDASGFARVCRCEWVRGASGFVGASGFAVRRSLYSLYLSLRAWFGNGETILMISDWVRRGWVWTIGAVWSSCFDAIFLLRRRRSSCSFSLSLFYFPRPEII